MISIHFSDAQRKVRIRDKVCEEEIQNSRITHNGTQKFPNEMSFVKSWKVALRFEIACDGRLEIYGRYYEYFPSHKRL